MAASLSETSSLQHGKGENRCLKELEPVHHISPHPVDQTLNLKLLLEGIGACAPHLAAPRRQDAVKDCRHSGAGQRRRDSCETSNLRHKTWALSADWHVRSA